MEKEKMLLMMLMMRRGIEQLRRNQKPLYIPSRLMELGMMDRSPPLVTMCLAVSRVRRRPLPHRV